MIEHSGESLNDPTLPEQEGGCWQREDCTSEGSTEYLDEITQEG